MRPVLLADVRAAATALAALAPSQRDAVLSVIVERAQAADRYRKRLRRVHPFWGDGTLAAAARSVRPTDEPLADDAAYLDATLRVLVLLAARRGIAPPTLSL